MTERGQIYKCNICGNIVEVVHAGKGQLVCCEQPMELLEGKTEDVGMEKHVPVIEKLVLSEAEGTDIAVKVKVGSIPHPMEEDHYIEWVEVIADGQSYRKFLKPGDSPEAEFEIKADRIEAREYCIVHGLWRSG